MFNPWRKEPFTRALRSARRIAAKSTGKSWLNECLSNTSHTTHARCWGKGKILRQFENFKIYKDLCGKQLNRDWGQKFLFSTKKLSMFLTAVVIASLEIIIQLKIVFLIIRLKHVLRTKMHIPITALANGFSHAYILISLMQFNISLIIRTWKV